MVSHVLTPWRLGPVVLRNRVLTSAHTENMADDEGVPTDRLVAYHRARARGGVGLIISSGVRVQPGSRIPKKLWAFGEGAPEGFGRLADAVRAEGAAFVVQLSETGRVFDAPDAPPISASAIPWRDGAPVPHALSKRELATLRDHYATAARCMAGVGVDGIEIQLAHGTLLQQFLSPLSNERSDGFGGDLRGRLRFPMEVVGAIREQVANGMALGIRVSADEFVPGGLTPEDVLEATGLLLGQHALDFVHVSHSAYVDAGTDSLTTQVADMYYGIAPFAHLPRMFKEAFPDTTVIGVCKVPDLETAEELVTGGACDLVAMTRAHIADPDIIRKHVDGNARLIRRCIYCNQGCVGNLEVGRAITCVTNPGVGLEGAGDDYAQLSATLADEGQTRAGELLVVGGGPAGVEAAIAGRRAGYGVTLVERGKELGGQLRLAARLDGRARWAALVEDQTRLVDELGVDVRLETEGDEELVGQEHWTAVVLACGSRPTPRELPGHGRMATVEDVLEGRWTPRPGGKVALIDEDGGWRAFGLATHLAGLGVAVEVASRFDVLAPGITLYSKLGHKARMRALGVGIQLAVEVVGREGRRLILREFATDREVGLDGVDDVVLAGPRAATVTPATQERYAALGARVLVVGDAYTPRSALEAVRDGRGIDLAGRGGPVPK